MAPRGRWECGGRPAGACACAALFLGVVAALVGDPAAAVPSPCTVDVSVPDKEKVAEITSTSPDAVSFSGTVTVSLPPLAERAVVTLTAVVDTEWVATLSPASITVTNQRSIPFTLTVVVPPGEPASHVGTATVTGRMTAAGVQCQDQETDIHVTPAAYLDSVAARADPANLTVRGALASLSLLLDAKANTDVTLELSYTGANGVALSGPQTVTLAYGESGLANASERVQVNVGGALPGSYPVAVHVHATNAAGKSADGQATANVTIPLAAGLLDSPSAWVPLAGLAAVGAGAAVLWWRKR